MTFQPNLFSSFSTRLSTMNDGLARQIFSNSEVNEAIRDFYKGVATPLVWNAKIKYDNVDETIQSSHMVFKERELVVLGKLKGNDSFFLILSLDFLD